MPPPLPLRRFVPELRTGGDPTVPFANRRGSSDTDLAGSQDSDSFEHFKSFKGPRSSSAAGSLHSWSSDRSKASQRSWEEDDVFDQVLQAISRELENSINILKTKSASRFAKLLTKTGRSHSDMQRALKSELERFRGQVEGYYGISGQKIHTGAFYISEEYKECRGRCYTQILEVQDAIAKELRVIKGIAASTVDMDDSHLLRIAHKFSQFENIFARISQAMNEPSKPRKSKDAQSSHEAEKKYECSNCGKRFSRKIGVERHRKWVHGERDTWSCSALSTYDKAFFESEIQPGDAYMCGYCGKEFGPGLNHMGYSRQATEHDWDERVRHIQEDHEFGKCNSSKKFFRAYHFRHHLEHSHQAPSGKWINLLENACLTVEELRHESRKVRTRGT